MASTSDQAQFWHKNVKNEDIEKAQKAFKSAHQYHSLDSAYFDEQADLVESVWSYTDVSDLTSSKSYLCISSLNHPRTSR